MLLRDPGQSNWVELSFEGKAFPVYLPTNIWVTQGNSLFDALQIRALIGLNDKPIEGAGVCVCKWECERMWKGEKRSSEKERREEKIVCMQNRWIK